MASRKGFWTETLAFYVLESMGFELVSYRHRIVKDGVEVAEVDALARKSGELYAVEVKSGRISTTDIRQAVANAQLLGAKPLIVARGFSDKSAEVYARELGVEVVLLPDYLHFVSTEELLQLLEDALIRTIDRLLDRNIESLSEEELRVLREIASSRDADEACRRLGVDSRSFSQLLGSLREKGVISGGSFEKLRVQARIALILRRLVAT
ncbi:endonuclease [Infirmifilum lucidum]|uniref:Endonuclease n=1 Tax=Infirmifilum lucidum TaxID=2776706 RepID=A0A7L9FFJ4_9CREN|nr:endonuclease [Infirmifilum lucidum]QOJ78447.1 endonuclease [Infirmifilum lucidum]